MNFSIYDLDDDIRRLLNLDNFLNGLSVNDFIEELSKDHFLKGAEVNKLEYLDPKPYIRTFESTLRELKQLSNEANDRKTRAEREVDEYELKHSDNVLQLIPKITNIESKFDNLDDKISHISARIDPLDHKLNKITNSRDRSTETIFLIRAYHGFYTKEKYDPLENLRTSKKYDDKIKCARTVNNLSSLAKKIDSSSEIPKTQKCVSSIEKFSELMERQLLNRFEVASEENEFDTMKEIAKILFEFNGGANVVQAFVSKNDLLLEAERQDEDEVNNSILDNEALWVSLSDPNYGGGEILKDEASELLLNRLRVAIKGQARIVKQVFDDPIPVLKIFIQRIYAQMIQLKVTTILQYSISVSSLAHVRVLHALYVLVGDFTKDVKEFLTTNEFDTTNELSLILDQSFYDLFIEYLSDNTYFNREKKNLEDIIYNIVHKFNVFNEKALAGKHLTTRLENLDNAEYNGGKDGLSGDRFSFHFSEKRRLQQFKAYMSAKLADRSRNSTDNNHFDADYQEFAKLNITKVEIITKSCIESIARVLELTPNKSPEYSLEILEILLFDFGKLYIGGGLEVAYDTVRQQNLSAHINSNNNFDFTYLSTFNLCSEILYLVSTCIRKIILPCTVNHPSIRNRMISLTNGYISNCETSLNIIMAETIDLVAARISHFLSKQKKKDFLSDTVNDYDTEACEAVSDFVTVVFETFSSHLNNTNLTNILIKIGMNLLNQLLEHFKNFTINSTGGITLTKDVIRYQSVIDQWQLSELSEKFQLLREISNLFTVHPNLINSLVTEGQLANLKPYTIKQYVSKRSDFNPSYIERFFNFK